MVKKRIVNSDKLKACSADLVPYTAVLFTSGTNTQMNRINITFTFIHIIFYVFKNHSWGIQATWLAHKPRRWITSLLNKYPKSFNNSSYVEAKTCFLICLFPLNWKCWFGSKKGRLAGSVGEPLCWGEAFVPRLRSIQVAVRFIIHWSRSPLLFGSRRIWVCSRRWSEIQCCPKRDDFFSNR